MPTIKFKLKDPKKCDGCFMIKKEVEHGGYYLFCKAIDGLDVSSLNRPQACIDEHGE